MATKTIEEFESITFGHGFNHDGFFGWQCWDLFAEYCKYLGYEVINTTSAKEGGSGYAKDLYNFRNENGILENFKFVQTPVKGDVVVFGESIPYTPKSHVGIVIRVEDSRILVLGQNQGGKPHPNGADYGSATNEIFLPRASVLGYFRPKCFTTRTSEMDVKVLNKLPKNAKKISKQYKYFYPNRTLRILLAPNVSVAKIYKFYGVDQVYKMGSFVVCDYYVDHDGFRWYSWKSKINGERHWIKRGKVKDGKIIVSYGKVRSK